MRKFCYWFMLVFALLGCVPELPVQPVPVVDGYPEGAKVTVSFSASNIAGMPGTKTLDAQVSLDSLYLAVFGSSGYLKEYVKADSIMHVNDTALTFKATLTLSDKPRSIHFIGNGPSTLDFGYDTDILPSLLSKDEAQSYWQMMESVLITADLVDGKYVSTCNDQFQDIPLVRNFAKIELSADTASYFEPTSFAVFNVPSKGSVVPYYEKAGKKLFVKNYDTCGFVTLTTKIGYPGNLPDSTDFIWSPAKYDSLVSCKATPLSEVYLYERPVPTSQNLPTYVIVKGAYNGNPNDPDSVNHFTRWTGKEYYYKIDLMEGGEYYPILRNFKYQIRINKILSRGHDTPEAAAASAGSAAVSADITTSHLNDISDGEARLVVQPWMSYAFTKRQVNNKMLNVKFFSDVMSGDPDMSYGSVTCEILPMPDGEEDVIESVSIGHPVLASGTEKGWRTITFSTTEPGAPGTAARTQVLRVSGTYKTDNDETRTLYRDVRITLQPLQRMQLSVDSPDDTGSGVPRDTAKIVRLNVGIPVDLTESMFPITFVIEPEDMSLTPDNQILNNNLPVAAQTSISDHAGYAGKRAFQFSRTLTYAEYRTLPPSLDLDGEPIRTFTCQFKTTRRDNATTIWVANEYFSKAHVSFRNPLANRLNYFYVEAREESIDQCMVKLEYSANNNQKLQFQKNDDGWATYSSNSEIRLKAGDRVYFRGNVKNWSGVTKFTGQGLYNVGGNIASLFCNDFTSEDIDLHWGEDQTGWLFTSFFLDEQGLVDASELVLPMATMTEKGYQFMFQGCTSLTAAPELPATTLANNCYQSMFQGCTSLTTAPALPATALEANCYQSMFQGCTQLTAAPALPASSLATCCYRYMFQGCTNLTAAPALPATVLATYCYDSMFRGCTALTTAPALACETLVEGCYNSMFRECTSLATAPALPASTLVKNCYNNMFNGCSSLRSVICMAATGINSNGSTSDWLKGVPNTAEDHGEFVYNGSAVWHLNDSEIPTYWVKHAGIYPVFPKPFDPEQPF